MIEALLYEHLKKNNDVLSGLASYNGELAVFNQESPDDMDEGWEGTQYGRIVYAVDLTDDPERQISGTLAVDVYCENGKQFPEDFEPIVRGLIDGYFFTTQESTIAAQWRASNYFTEAGKKVIGVTITFDLLAFPIQATVEMDPIPLLNQWSENELSKATELKIKVINHSDLDSVWKPTDKEPAIYWRIISISPCSYLPETYHCIWQTAELQCNIIAESKEVMILVARYIDSILSMKKRLIFEDDSPLMIDNVQVNTTRDPMKVGQLTVHGTYGILKVYQNVGKFDHICIDGR